MPPRKSRDSVFIKLLKEYTNIDHDFIDTFFKKYKIGGDLNFDIKDEDVAIYLDIQLRTLRSRLRGHYESSDNLPSYIEKADYIRIKSGVTVTYYLNYACFERLAMEGYTEQGDTIRLYFSKLREFIFDNADMIYQSLENNQNLKCIYKI